MTGAVWSRTLESLGPILAPPYEVLCGPKAAAYFQSPSNESSPSYAPTMLLAEDSLGDYGTVSIIGEV